MSGLDYPGDTFRLNREPKQLISWWQTAPVEGFYARCKVERERMRSAERIVSTPSVNVLFDGTRKRKEFNP